jgi:hypothetical protein
MPWCPHCDEVFPEGPDCPRCSTPLVERAAAPSAAELQFGGGLPKIKVPRRYRRAFDRLSGSEPAPKPLVAVALAFILFSLGFLLGRMDSLSSVGPTIRPLGGAPPLRDVPVEGGVAYAVLAPGGDPTAALVRHGLSSGELDPRSRVELPISPSRAMRTRLTEMDGSVALAVSDDRSDLIGVFPIGRAPLVWLEGTSAAWEDPRTIVILDPEGTARRWTFGSQARSEALPGRWSWVFQTARGPVLESSGAHRFLSLPTATGAKKTIDVPPSAKVLAVSSDGRRAIVQADRPALWDGRTLQPLRVEGFEVAAASFAPDGRRAAAVLERPRTSAAGEAEPALGIVDPDASVALRPIGHVADGCEPSPAWDRTGRWVYTAPGDGSLYAIEADGARVAHVAVRIAGCGLAWTE